MMRICAYIQFDEYEYTYSHMLSLAAWALVTYDFESTDEKQMSVKRGDKLAIVSKRAHAQGWWKAVLPGPTPAQCRVGYVPVDYVLEISPSDQPLAAAESLIN